MHTMIFNEKMFKKLKFVSEFRSNFLSEVSYAIYLKAEQMKSRKNFNCRAVEVTENEKERIIDRDDEIKDIAGPVLTYNSKNCH